MSSIAVSILAIGSVISFLNMVILQGYYYAEHILTEWLHVLAMICTVIDLEDRWHSGNQEDCKRLAGF